MSLWFHLQSSSTPKPPIQRIQDDEHTCKVNRARSCWKQSPVFTTTVAPDASSQNTGYLLQNLKLKLCLDFSFLLQVAIQARMLSCKKIEQDREEEKKTLSCLLGILKNSNTLLTMEKLFYILMPIQTCWQLQNGWRKNTVVAANPHSFTSDF